MFIADLDGIQTLSWQETDTDVCGGATIKTIQLRIPPVPESSSTALLGLAGLGFILRRSR